MQRLDELAAMIRERRIGFAIDEVMRGYHQFEPGHGPEGQLPMEFRVTWGNKDLSHFLNPLGDGFLLSDLAGRVSIDFLCRDLPCRGSFELKYLSEHALRYSFEFEAEGTEYSYLGEKVNIWPWNLPFSHTTCFGTLCEADSGKLVSRSVTYFKMTALPGFLASLRLA